jgi:hypothetical protein
MKEGFKVFGKVNSQGQLEVYNRDIMVNKMERMSNRYVEIEFTERDGELSHNWRSYYFAVVVKEWNKLLHYLGDPLSLKDTDTLLREMFLFKEVYNEEEDTYSKELHTLKAGETEVSKKEFRFFCGQCIQKAAELDWEIPFPNEQINSK